MGRRRTLLVGIPALAGVVAAAAVWSYLGGVQERAYGNARLVDVYVVAREIKRGETGDRALAESLVRRDVIPAKFRPETAVTDVDALRGRVASTDLPPGQIVSDGLFVEPRAATLSFAHRIPEGQVAISVRVDDVRGVANLIAPGDQVDILVPSPDGMRTLFQNVDVIAVGVTGTAAPGEPPPPPGSDNGLVTFSVPPLAAEKIAMVAASPDEGLYLTLVPPENQAVPLPPVNRGNLFQGSLSPYA